MRVLILPSWYPTTEKPVNGIFIREQADALSARHEVRVLYLDVLPRGHKRKPRRTLKRDRGYVEEIWEVPNRRFVWQFAYLFTLAKALGAMRRDFKPDIAHCHIAVPAAWAASLLKPLLRAPIVLTEHSSEFRSWLSRPGLAWMARRGMHGANLVIAVSEGQRKRITKSFPRIKHICTISNIVDTSLFSPAPLPSIDDGYQLLFVGLLDTDQKGLHILLDALAILCNDGSIGLKVRIVGDGRLRAQYETQARNLGLTEVVHFQGLCSRHEVARLLKESHALVLPSLHEAAPVVIIEAQSSGRPIVATSCGGPEYMIDESNGLVVDPGKAEPLASAINNVLTHLGRYDPEQIANAAAARYGYDAIIGSLTKAYESLTRTDKSPLSE
jgi:glycosyltransferase involved in cell wall biosynthesis